MTNNSFELSSYDFSLPEKLIAQHPVSPRDKSKLMVLDKETGTINHQFFSNLKEILSSRDLLIRNNTKVFPARLIGKKELTEGQVEIFLHRKIKEDLWEVIGRNLKANNKIYFENSKLEAIVESKSEQFYQVKFNISGEDFFNEIEKIGLMPLPPYIKRAEKNISDSSDYQTVFAKEKGSVAAPTAGLHFTKELDEALKRKKIEILEITLHVGLGTFYPIKTNDIREHKMHSEYYSVDKSVLEKIIDKKRQGGKIITVGTTTTRTLEAVFALDWQNIESNTISGFTDIFIYPGYKFKVVDGMITNFHLPKSSLLLLISAFAGKKKIDKAYKEAIEKEYRFYSYGDAMLIK